MQFTTLNYHCRAGRRTELNGEMALLYSLKQDEMSLTVPPDLRGPRLRDRHGETTTERRGARPQPEAAHGRPETNKVRYGGTKYEPAADRCGTRGRRARDAAPTRRETTCTVEQNLPAVARSAGSRSHGL